MACALALPLGDALEAAGGFGFKGLASGRCWLRVVTPVAETQWYSVSAMISPPPLRLRVDSVTRDGTGAGSGFDFELGRLHPPVGPPVGPRSDLR